MKTVHLRDVAANLNISVLAKPEVTVRRWNSDWTETQFDGVGNLKDSGTQAAVNELVTALVRAIRVTRIGDEVLARQLSAVKQ